VAVFSFGASGLDMGENDDAGPSAAAIQFETNLVQRFKLPLFETGEASL
jgi:hypothetical protein